MDELRAYGQPYEPIDPQPGPALDHWLKQTIGLRELWLSNSFSATTYAALLAATNRTYARGAS